MKPLDEAHHAVREAEEAFFEAEMEPPDKPFQERGRLKELSPEDYHRYRKSMGRQKAKCRRRYPHLYFKLPRSFKPRPPSTVCSQSLGIKRHAGVLHEQDQITPKERQRLKALRSRVKKARQEA